MKRLTANNFDQAFKEVTGIDAKSGKKLKKMINHIDRFMYHLITISIQMTPGKVKNKVTMNVLKLHKHAIESIERNMHFHGYANLIILHNPSKMEEKQEAGVPGYQKMAIEKDIKSNEKEKMEAEVNRRVKDALKKQAEENAKAEEEAEAEAKLKAEEAEAKAQFKSAFIKAVAGTKAEMSAYIEANSIDAGNAKTNDELIAVIKAWYKTKGE